MLKFEDLKPGMKLKLRKNLENGKEYGEDSINDEMYEFIKHSNYITVSYKYDRKFKIEEFGWNWTLEMCEGSQCEHKNTKEVKLFGKTFIVCDDCEKKITTKTKENSNV